MKCQRHDGRKGLKVYVSGPSEEGSGAQRWGPSERVTALLVDSARQLSRRAARSSALVQPYSIQRNARCLPAPHVEACSLTRPLGTPPIARGEPQGGSRAPQASYTPNCGPQLFPRSPPLRAHHQTRLPLCSRPPLPPSKPHRNPLPKQGKKEDGPYLSALSRLASTISLRAMLS